MRRPEFELSRGLIESGVEGYPSINVGPTPSSRSHANSSSRSPQPSSWTRVLTGQPVCVVDVERHLPLAQSTVSYHLKALLDAGLIDREKRGRWSYYSLNPDRLAHVAEAISSYRDRATAKA